MSLCSIWRFLVCGDLLIKQMPISIRKSRGKLHKKISEQFKEILSATAHALHTIALLLMAGDAAKNGSIIGKSWKRD